MTSCEPVGKAPAVTDPTLLAEQERVLEGLAGEGSQNE